jgi:hypothetical protein
VGLGRPRGYASAENILFDILGKTDVNPVGTMNMRERLSTHPKLNVIPAAVKGLNARH